MSDFKPRPALLERMRVWLEAHPDVPELMAVKAVFARKGTVLKALANLSVRQIVVVSELSSF